MKIEIRLNGEMCELPQSLNIAQLLEHFNLPRDRVAVERNRSIVPKLQWESVAVIQGDELEVVHFVGGAAPWTHLAPLPGGDFPWDGVEALVARARGLWPFLTERHVRRLVAAYGTRIDKVVGPASRVDTVGGRFGAELSTAEVRYLMRHEWAETADDVLWRRTKLGLQASAEQTAALERFMAEATGHKAAAE